MHADSRKGCQNQTKVCVGLPPSRLFGKRPIEGCALGDRDTCLSGVRGAQVLDLRSVDRRDCWVAAAFAQGRWRFGRHSCSWFAPSRNGLRVSLPVAQITGRSTTSFLLSESTSGGEEASCHKTMAHLAFSRRLASSKKWNPLW